MCSEHWAGAKRSFVRKEKAFQILASSVPRKRHSGNMSRIYWDTMLFVYWLEDHPLYAKRVRHILSANGAAAGSALHQLIYRRRDSGRPLQIGLVGES